MEDKTPQKRGPYILGVGDTDSSCNTSRTTKWRRTVKEKPPESDTSTADMHQSETTDTPTDAQQRG